MTRKTFALVAIAFFPSQRQARRQSRLSHLANAETIVNFRAAVCSLDKGWLLTSWHKRTAAAGASMSGKRYAQ